MSRRRRNWLIALSTAALVTAANASQGAYFSQSWGWVALAFLVPTTVLLILGAVERPARYRAAFAVLVCALASWTALSTLWSISQPGSVREVERMLAYVALALAVALVLRRGDGPAVLAGALAGITAISAYALATRLLPDRFDSFYDPELGYRLSAPIGYWNALGLFAAMGALLAIGLAAHARLDRSALAAAASLPVLLSALYFTFSRGAWIALFAAGVAMVLLDARRLRLVWTSALVLLPSVVAVAVSSGKDALTDEGASRTAVVAQGHDVAAIVGSLVIASAGLAVAARVVSRRVPAGRSSRRAFDVAVYVVVAVCLIGGLVRLGGPVGAVDEFRDRFRASPTATADLNTRLFSLSGNGRAAQIEIGWDIARAHPWLGTGAGTYEYYWYERRPVAYAVRDTHSLYVETFQELGVVGLALLVAALALPLASALRARRNRLVPAAAAALLAWMIHASIDWDWEMVGVTAVALLAAGACLATAERRRLRLLAPTTRLLLVGFAGALSALAVVSLVGNQALFAAREKEDRKQWADAVRDARHAHRLLPWSFEPLVALGDARAGAGDRQGALAAYRDAASMDPRNWTVWLRLGQVAHGDERARAYARVRALNPLEQNLPGEGKGSG